MERTGAGEGDIIAPAGRAWLGAMSCEGQTRLALRGSCTLPSENDSRAGVTQLAECLLPKQDVAGSNPVSRSNPSDCHSIPSAGC